MKSQELIQQKIRPLAEMDEELARWRYFNKKIVFTNGCFDLIHNGHLELLQFSKDLGDVLIVGLNSDASVKRLKGAERPIKDQDTRSNLLASLLYVDRLILFEEDTPIKLIEYLCPQILVKGGDYEKKDIVGAEFVEQKGGQVVIFPTIQGLSSTNLIG